jgi:uncharacterized damage-inducible protein DinB
VAYYAAEYPAGNFALGNSSGYYDQEEPASLARIRVIFNQVDEMMLRLSEQFTEHAFTPVKGYKWPQKYIETDAFGIFTHVITHEFHHKGQVMAMARLLGHVPPEYRYYAVLTCLRRHTACCDHFPVTDK